MDTLIVGTFPRDSVVQNSAEHEIPELWHNSVELMIFTWDSVEYGILLNYHLRYEEIQKTRNFINFINVVCKMYTITLHTALYASENTYRVVTTRLYYYQSS